MSRLLKFFKTIWTSKVTTAALLLVGAGGFAASILYSLGPPAPAKVMVRFAFSVVVFAHVLTVYPGHFRRVLFGSKERLVDLRDREKASPSFYLMSGAVLTAGFLARVWSLASFLDVDEPKWLIYRIPDFFNNLLAFAWQDLLISDKPGVTLAWLTEVGLLFTNKEGNGLNLARPELLLASRLPLVIANILLLFWLTSLVRRATKSEPVALLFLVLTSTNPTIMGMARVVNPDSISWFFPLATALAFFLYLRENRPWDLAVCGFLFACGVLNKFNMLIILPFLPILAVVYYLFLEPKPDRLFFKNTAAAIARVYLAGWIFATILWPYLILAPWQYLNLTLLKPMIKPLALPLLVTLLVFWVFNDALEKGLQRSSRFLKTSALIASSTISLALIGAMIRSTPSLPSVERGTKVMAPFAKLVINNYYFHIYSQTTLTVILYVLALIGLAAATLPRNKPTPSLSLGLISVLFVLFYLTGSAATHHLTSPRYQIPVFPAVALLISAILVPIVARVAGAKFVKVSLAGATILSFALVLPFAPYYLLHHNNFLPVGRLVFDGAGIGGYEAAQYLNKKPNAKKIRAFTSYPGFGGFFVGQTIPRDGDPFNPPVDYLVIFQQSAKQTIIGSNPKTDYYWRHQAKDEWQMLVNRVPVVKIVKYPKPSPSDQ